MGWKTCEREGQKLGYFYEKPLDAVREEDEPFITIVLLHDFLSDSEFQWKATVKKLIALGYAVLSVDLRGHGKSAPIKVAEIKTVYELVEDSIAVLDHAQVRKAVWVGSGIGGMQVMRAAIAFPERVHAMVLISTDPQACSWSDYLQHQGIAAMARTVGVSMAAPVAARLFLPSNANDELATQFRNKLSKLHVQSILSILKVLDGRSDVVKSLKNVSIPSLVLHGSEDQATKPECGELLAKALRDARLVIFEGVGHLLPNEDPQLLLQEVHEFIVDRKEDFIFS